MHKNKHNLVKRAEERKFIKLVDAARVNDAEIEIELLHNNGFIVLAVGEPTDSERYNWHQWGFEKQEINNILLQNILGIEYNTYLSMNSFKSPLSTISNLYSLNALWADMDYYKIDKYKDKTYLEMIQIISKNKLIKKAPPSFYVYSGKGFYPIWLIKDAHAASCLPLWNKLMREINGELEPYGADSLAVEASHVLKLAGSNNTKSNLKSKIVKEDITFNPKRYTLKELSALILKELPYTKDDWTKIKNKKKKTKKDKQVCKVHSLFNLHSLNYARMQDIQTLISIRDGDCKGTRELMLFLYRYWANCYHKCDETALQEILRINELFKEPLSFSEVCNATKNAAEAAELWETKLNEYWALDKKPSVKKFFYEDKSGAYIYSNKKLIELLSVKQNEMPNLLTIFNYQEKLRRKNEKRRQARLNENGLKQREQSKVDKIIAVGELVDKGLKNKDIVVKLGLAKGTVSKYAKEYLLNRDYYNSFVNNTEMEVSKELTRITDTELKLLVV